MFNVRIKRFLSTEQVQIFSEPLLSSDTEKLDRRKVVIDTGEIVPPNRKAIYSPFEDTGVVGYELHDEKSDIVARSVRRSKNKIYDVARCNEWEWFFTMTFNPKKVDSFNYEAVTEKLSQWLKNMRKKCPNMRYIVVPERHESGRWHFHGLFANCDELEFVDSGKRDKEKVIYNVGNYRLGWSTAIKVDNIEKTVNYIAKYITWELCDLTKGKKRYWYSRNCDVPQIIDLMVLELRDVKEKLVSASTYVKKVEGFIDVTYLDMPIYTTNANFSKRYRQILMNTLYYT